MLTLPLHLLRMESDSFHHVFHGRAEASASTTSVHTITSLTIPLPFVYTFVYTLVHIFAYTLVYTLVYTFVYTFVYTLVHSINVIIPTSYHTLQRYLVIQPRSRRVQRESPDRYLFDATRFSSTFGGKRFHEEGWLQYEPKSIHLHDPMNKDD